MNEVEEWKTVPNTSGIYKVSNMGRIKTIERYVYRKSGKVLRREKILKNFLDDKGYFRVGITFNDKRKQRLVHRVVAVAFIENPKNKPQVNHIDGNPRNNSVSNLEWVTPLENIRHAWENGLMNPRKKLDIIQVLTIKTLLMVGKKPGKICKYFNTDRSNIEAIRDGRTWKYI